jgi:hypothetical protein
MFYFIVLFLVLSLGVEVVVVNGKHVKNRGLGA